mgnify:CR=1 FL=1
MWSVNTNSVLGAILLALWLVWGANFIGDLLIPPAEPVQAKVSTEKAKAAAPAKKKTAAPAAQPLNELLAAASTEKGAKVVKKCVACHSFGKGGKNKVGPNLFAILGRERGAGAGYKYSAAIKKMGGKWGYADMDEFLAKPKAFMPGTKMAFPGLKKAGDRAALILYMRAQAGQPLPLP